MGFLEEMRARGAAGDYQRLLDGIPYARFLGITIDSVEDGRVVARLRFDQKIVGNPNLPAIHGGVLGAFLEMAAIVQLVAEGDGEGMPWDPLESTCRHASLSIL